MFKKTPTTRILFFLVWDVILISLAVYLAFILRFDGHIPNYSVMYETIALALIFHIPIFYFQGLYSITWSYVSTKELIALIKGSTISFLILTLVIFLSRDFPSLRGFPRSTLFISYVLVILFSGAIRFSKRMYRHTFKEEEEKARTLIVGAGDAGEQILRSIQGSSQTPFSPIGFVDDNLFKHKTLIHGVKVLGTIENIPEIVSEYRVGEVIVALPSAESVVIKKAVEISRKSGVQKIKILPLLSEIVDGQVSLSNIRDFKLEDLLDRDPILYDSSSIEKLIQGKNILVTGAAGSIGSELSRQIAKFNPASLLLLDQDETGIFNITQEIKSKFPQVNSIIADIQDKDRINRIFNSLRPNIVFHAAAYKHVPLMEKHASEAIKNNVFGTKTIAEASLNVGVEKFIFISTDKAVNPQSVMGASKRMGEMICQTLNQRNSTKFISVRFGNVLGSRGSVVPIFKQDIKKGGPIKVTHEEMKRYFMIIPEAVSLVLRAGEMGQGGEVFVLNMGNPVKIFDLAKQLIRLSGLEPDKDIPIIFTEPRSGEKLFEEMLTAEEGTIATEDKNIFKARLSLVDENKLKNSLEELKDITTNDNIKDVLKNAISNYIPHKVD